MIFLLTSITRNYTSIIYSMESPPEKSAFIPHTLRGHESAAYLSYIIDFYDRLPDYSIFIHPDKDQWHNDLFGSPTSEALSNLRLAAVDSIGYVNLRCKADPGCPVSMHPLDPTPIDIENDDVRAYMGEIYMELFQVQLKDVPRDVGGVCCGQFVVSRERIRQRPKSDYVRMIKWADETNRTHNFGVGWVFEKVWHQIFGMDAI